MNAPEAELVVAVASEPASLAWSDIYAQLGEFFKAPSAGFADDVASGRLARYFEAHLNRLGMDASLGEGLAAGGDVRAQLESEYRRLYLGPLPPYVVPVESVYKQWTDDPACDLPMARDKGCLMGDAALDMLRRYRAEGIELPESLSSMPDHAALLFEYMAHLLARGDDDACEVFLATHLDWLNDLTRDIRDIVADGVFVQGAMIAEVIVDRHIRELKAGRAAAGV